jgi:L-threonylcarbamoyladenylate synthase
MMLTTRVIPARENHPEAIKQALEVLHQGGTVAFPTDTVYGLAALASTNETIEKLFAIKERPQDRAIAVLLGQTSDLEKITQDPSPAALRLAVRFWPGPLTLVVPKHPQIPEIISPWPTIGVRIPDHPVALALLQTAGPLAVTSANLSGKANTTTAEEVEAQLHGRVDLILDGGETPGGIPSTVVDMTGETPVVLREGPITETQLLEIWSKPIT